MILRVKPIKLFWERADGYYDVTLSIHPTFATNAFLNIMALHRNSLPTTKALSHLYHFSIEKRLAEEYIPNKIRSSLHWPSKSIPYRLITLSTLKLMTSLPSPKIDRKGKERAIERDEEEDRMEERRIASEIAETGKSHLVLRTKTWFLFASKEDWIKCGVGVTEKLPMAEELALRAVGEAAGENVLHAHANWGENVAVSGWISSSSLISVDPFDEKFELEMEICPHVNAESVLFQEGPCRKLYRSSKWGIVNNGLKGDESLSKMCGCQSCKVDWTCPF